MTNNPYVTLETIVVGRILIKWNRKDLILLIERCDILLALDYDMTCRLQFELN